jgi:hypothetical protein
MGASHVRALLAEGATVVAGDILNDEGEARQGNWDRARDSSTSM